MHSKHLPDVGDCRSVIRRHVPEYLTIATVLAPWGTRGELRVRIETDFPDHLVRLNRVYLGTEHQPFDFEGFRQHKGYGLLKLKGCDDLATAEKLRDMEVQIPLAEAMPLEPGKYYVYQIEGLAVYTEEGELLGIIEEVLFTGSNQVYVIQGPRGEVLIPALRDVVLEVNQEDRRMIVRLPLGLLD